jgi:hypothetical protein
MSPFFTRDRFGHPQFIAGLLLLALLAQGVWLLAHTHLRSEFTISDLTRIEAGLTLWSKGTSLFGVSTAGPAAPDPAAPLDYEPELMPNPNHSPLWYLIAAGPLYALTSVLPADSQLDAFSYAGWFTRAPYLLFGVLLGASLWYVARRLYGNAGGYIALVLFCFSPGIVRSTAVWYAQPEIGAAWGAFGAVFTAIAVSHTLYAPREVILWNWRRILLLALSIALAIGSQFSLLITLPLALAFMLYLAPTRRGAAVVIWLAASMIGFALIFAAYGFRPGAFWDGMRHAHFLGARWDAFARLGAYQQVAGSLGQISPALALAIPAALVVFIAWPRTRYFGNAAPLIVAAVFLIMAVGSPHYPGLGFTLMAVPFLFVFVAGIFADLLETPQRMLVSACVWALLAANALWSLLELARVPHA